MAVEFIKHTGRSFQIIMELTQEEAEKVVDRALILNRVGDNILAGPAYLQVDQEQGLVAWKVAIYVQKNDQSKSIPTGEYVFVSQGDILGDVDFDKIRESAIKVGATLYE